MATDHANKVIQQVRRAILGEGADLSDGQLLTCFIEQRDAAAFAALVKRHGPMVWGVCRRVLAGHQDAEDAFQATFLVLIRKAAAVRPCALVGNFLYGVAYQTAIRVRAMNAKRRARERQVLVLPEPAAEEKRWSELESLLDQELSRLPDKYRVPVVLCDLEGKTYQEAARQIGCPEGTLAARLSRARAMLAKRLARHGLPVTGGMLAAVLSESATAAGVPITVVSSTTQAAGQTATGVFSTKVISLTEGVLKAMFLNKIKAMAAVLVLAGVLGGLLLFWSGWIGDGLAGAQEDRKPTPEHQGSLPPFTLTVGKYYQILLPNHRQWPGEQSLVLVQKNFANGWVEIKTEENQTAWLNLNQAMQVYLIPDPQKYHREAARQP